MKIYQVLWKNYRKTIARKPQDINNVPYKEMLPIRLRNHLSGKSDRQEEVACLQEMISLFSKMKNNDFNEKLCLDEIGILKNSYNKYMIEKCERKAVADSGIVQPGRDLTSKQLNKYFKLYPNPK